MLLEDLAIGGRFAVGAARGDQVPFVDDEDDAAAAFVGVAADRGVAGCYAICRVDDEECDVGRFKMAARHDDAEFFGHHFGFALAADAGSIDEAELVALEVDDLVDGVTRGSGDGRDDGAAGAGERVEQRGFADVGAADDGDGGFALLEFAVGANFFLVVFLVLLLVLDGFSRWNERAAFFGLALVGVFSFFAGSGGFFFQRRGNCRGDSVEKFADAPAVLGADGEKFCNAKLAEVLGLGSERVGFNLVDGEKDGLAAALQQAGQVVVRARQLSADVDNHDERSGFIERDFGLAVNFGGDELRIVGNDAAGVDEAIAAAGPFIFAVDAVAGDAGLIADDRSPTPGEAIEERGFADVGAADDSNERQRGRAGRDCAGGLAIGGQRDSVAACQGGAGVALFSLTVLSRWEETKHCCLILCVFKGFRFDYGHLPDRISPEVSMHIHLSGVGMQSAYGTANNERTAAAERAAEVRKRLLKARQTTEASSDSGDGVTLLIGQWTDSRHSEVLPPAQYHEAAEGEDSDFK